MIYVVAFVIGFILTWTAIWLYQVVRDCNAAMAGDNEVLKRIESRMTADMRNEINDRIKNDSIVEFKKD